jgi:DNA invertase Pin-like site-specific DNA recombinase
MTSSELIPAIVLKRKAVYVRQSTQSQIMTNLEGKRRQYDLVDVARQHGFVDVEIIDDDLGRSASGTVARPGFDRLVAWLCAGKVGAVLCFDASRLARNGRDWHHLLELCGLVEARVIDGEGVYNPCRPNDRLLLGMKGSISEFELGVLRTRMLDAARSKASRGELRLSVPFGYIWHRDAGLGLDPDLRLQEVVRLIFARFRDLGSARQVLLSMRADRIHFPRPSDEGRMTSFDWMPIRYRNVIAVLKNPFYAGVYVYGKSEKRTSIVEGRARRSCGHGKPIGTWEVMIKDHHEGYISWAEYERNQKQLALNNYGRAGGVKSGRGGTALLSGILTCRRCGRRLSVAYTGNPQSRPVYRCDKPNLMMGLPRCMTFGGPRVDAAVARELLLTVEPMAIEAAFEAERMHREQQEDQQRILDMEMQQAHYEASLAERRYAACDPNNRLIAAQLERNWETALRRVRDLEMRQPAERPSDIKVDPSAFTNLADNLSAAWHAPNVTMRARQQLLRTLIADIIVDVDARDVVLTIHWRGGQHSELRVRKPRAGEHGCATTEDALAVMRSMAGRWSDEHIAASLNRMGMPTGQGKTWTAHRVGSVRRVRAIHAYRSAEKDGEWLTMTEAAKLLGVTHHTIRRLIYDSLLRPDWLRHRRQIAVHHPHEALRRHAFTERRKTLHVAEHHRHNPALAFDSPCRLIDEAFGHSRVDVAAERPPHLFFLTQLADHAIECRRQLADLIAGYDVDGSIELTRLDVACALQQTSNRARDPATDQACKQQSQDRGYGGDNVCDPDRPLLIDHNGRTAGLDLRQHACPDFINFLVELVPESVRPLERALDLRKVMRIKLAYDSALFFTQKPSNICYGRFYPAVDVRQRYVVRRGAGVLDD